jgi:archaemetzincin
MAVRAPAQGGHGPQPPAAFTFDPTLYSAKLRPEPDDWMASHHERYEGFPAYVQKGPARPTPARRVIVLQPLGPFAADEWPDLETLREYLSIFFQVEARVAPPLPLPTRGMRRRGSSVFAYDQYRADVVIDEVLKPRLPADAICYLGVTMADLFPAPTWNYVFGWASLDERVGAYSLDRFRPRYDGEPDTLATRRRTLRRQLKALAHEAGHMFSLPHCTFYECVMNGADTVEELDRHVVWPCPLCLRKLQWNLGFDVRKREEALRAFYERHDLGDEVDWLDRRLAHLDVPPPKFSAAK